MKTQQVLATAALLATTAVAAPANLENRVQARAAGTQRKTHPLIPVSSVAEVQGPEADNVTHVQYSSNWAGIVIESPPSGTTFKEVTASFVVPTPKAAGGSGSYSASAWVGIDGDTYGNAILQTGCDFTASSSGATSYDCWYEWFPDYAYDFSGFTPKAGDTITATVIATSKTAGTASLKNSRTGQTVSKSLTAPSSNSALGGQNAEWIVEDFDSGNSQVPFANFGTVTFSGATAYAGSQTMGPSSGTVIDIQQNGQVLTSVSESSNSVTVKYV